MSRGLRWGVAIILVGWLLIYAGLTLRARDTSRGCESGWRYHSADKAIDGDCVPMPEPYHEGTIYPRPSDVPAP